VTAAGVTPGVAEQQRLAAELAADGFAVYGPPAVPPELFEALCRDARTQRPRGWGQPQRQTVEHQAWRAEPGDAGRAFLNGPEILALLQALVGEPVLPSPAGTCYTYYEGPGGHMATHLDRAIDCSFTLILYLEAEWPAGAQPGPGLELELWPPGPLPEPDCAPSRRVASRPNLLLIGKGAQVPHRRPPLAAGERLVALTACYAPALLRRSPETLQPDPATAAQHCDKGDRHWNAGELPQAQSCFSRAVEADPGCDRAWSGLGHGYWYQHRFIEAQEAFTRAAGAAGDDPSHWSNIGLCLRDQGAFEPAIRCFRVALMLDPRYAPALNEWANVLQDQGRLQDALGLYARALAVDPKRAVVHHNLGVAYRRLGQPERAENAFGQALARDPGYAHSLEELALLDIERGSLDAARVLLRRAGSARAGQILAELGEGAETVPEDGRPCGP
jgi:tetratricopeptide (TPR) repeat protein